MAAVRFDKNDIGSLLITGNEDELAKVITFVNNSINSNDAIKKAFCDEENDEEHDAVNHPSHYEHGIECIDEMILLYGVVETMMFCKLNAHKYRKRAFEKGGKEDMDKSDWYMKEYAYLDSKSDIEIKEEIYKKYNLLDN
jgi:hypothetical protein